jgi:N6-L-threonylcarbamoyladenine synthase
MLTLGIETSCDETAVSVVTEGRILSSRISSSVHMHSRYGGVVPEIASRYHTEYIYPVLNEALSDAGISMDRIGLIAVTMGPGLPGSLLVGAAFAKALAMAADIPLVGVDHLPAHILACYVRDGRLSEDDIRFPFLGMVVSGGHTSFYICRGYSDHRTIGKTLDDAVGEAFDKVARIMELGYPGGPVVEKRAGRFRGGEAIPFPMTMLRGKDNLDFSFSGLKTAVMYYWKDCERTEKEKDRICYSFQRAVAGVLSAKAGMALDATGSDTLSVGGGVVQNTAVRKALSQVCAARGARLYLPEKQYCGDNAAMIALLGEKLYLEGERSGLDMKVCPSGSC